MLFFFQLAVCFFFFQISDSRFLMFSLLTYLLPYLFMYVALPTQPNPTYLIFLRFWGGFYMCLCMKVRRRGGFSLMA